MSYLQLFTEFVSARNKKRRPHVPAISSPAIVNIDLNPRGSVLAGGELWSAESACGKPIPRRTTVTVIGFRDHFLLVEEQS